MECKFVVGQKVVCIAQPGKWWANLFGFAILSPVQPRPDAIYKVTVIEPNIDGRIYIGLKEFPPVFTFDHRWFRPLQDRPKEADTDISVFTPLLNAKTLEPAR